MKSRGFFAELNDFSLLMARTTGLTPPFTVEEVIEWPLTTALEDIQLGVQDFARLQQGQYAQSVCGCYPPDRLIRRATLDNPGKTRDPSFLPQYLNNQFKVDLSTTAVAVLNANGGAGFDVERKMTKEIIFCGASRQSLIEQQNRLVDFGVFPTRLELGSTSMIGGIGSVMALNEETMPTLLLEVGANSSLVLIVNGSQLDVARPIPHGFNSMYPVVQQELGLKDEESARKLFSSSTFDFTEMGALLLKKLLKELQASTGFYEVQTGQTIGHIFVSGLPENLNWIPATLARTLGVEVFSPDIPAWCEHQDIVLADTVDRDKIKTSWFGLFGLMGNYAEES